MAAAIMVIRYVRLMQNHQGGLVLWAIADAPARGRTKRGTRHVYPMNLGATMAELVSLRHTADLDALLAEKPAEGAHALTKWIKV